MTNDPALLHLMPLTSDLHGQAALMLCESLILLLLEQDVIRKDQVTEAVDDMIEMKLALAGRTGSAAVSVASVILLQDIQRSLAAAADAGSARAGCDS